jgi:hypothetical protein
MQGPCTLSCMSQPAVDSSLVAPLDGLEAAYAAAVAAVEELAAANPRAGYRAATALGKLLRTWADDQAPRRGRFALAVKERDALTLVGLADSLESSKSLAKQLVDIGKREGES